ncbi:cell envelope integrity protein CreD [uncultured Flavobacterium sp.]|uniref:cell envelope integrity protein CreD n=1 Tax=uncultured Flavobacterium sp. TaxID=165435 RepID=UPI0025EEDBA3|nr:cell envelope integrity protein CreD [uncultured Flavobacterium sp.]
MEILNQKPHENPHREPNANFIHSTTAKIIMVGVLTLVLLIPLQYVKSLIDERAQNQRKTEQTISRQWGDNVHIYGPVLKVPYHSGAAVEYAYIFPDRLVADADVQSQSRRQSMYEAAIFNAKVKFSGNFSDTGLGKTGILPENLEWGRATVLMNTNGLKSIRDAIAINFNGSKYTLEPVASENPNDSLISLETKPIDLTAARNGGMPFQLDVSYSGSKRLGIAPIGKTTEAKMTSNWHSPRFGGYIQPEKEAATDKGFIANWKISQLNRPFAQQHIGSLPNLASYSFYVDFLIPVDEYQQNMRASKYGFLVIGLTFLIFFLIQSISKISIHIFQYTMIGLALVMFYTLLISITEHSSFRIAYLIAGVSVVAMITLYSISILKNRKFPMFIAAALSGLYAFIYVIIQLEHYALLAGSIGLFLILGAVMYFSRKIDWGK